MQCPQCKSEFAPSETKTMPFCSERCRTIDLGRWLDEKHQLPLASDPEADEVPEDNWAGEPIADKHSESQ